MDEPDDGSERRFVERSAGADGTAIHMAISEAVPAKSGVRRKPQGGLLRCPVCGRRAERRMTMNGRQQVVYWYMHSRNQDDVCRVSEAPLFGESGSWPAVGLAAIIH